jgi:hypothetical protein
MKKFVLIYTFYHIRLFTDTMLTILHVVPGCEWFGFILLPQLRACIFIFHLMFSPTNSPYQGVYV